MNCLKRATYQDGVSLVARNDDPHERDVDAIALSMATILLAWLFKVELLKVATDILRARERADATTL